MRIVTTFLITLMMFACKDHASDKPIYASNEKSKNLKFAILNFSEISMYDVTAGLHDTTLVFPEILAKTQTQRTPVCASYSAGYLKFKDNKQREYTFRPIDHVGEKLYTDGYMTFIIEYIDTITRQGRGGFSYKE